jgi:hypothetical protein
MRGFWWSVGSTLLSLLTISGGANAQAFFAYGHVSASAGAGPATNAAFGPYENTVASAPNPQLASVTLGDGATGTAEITETPVLVSALASAVHDDNVSVTAHLDYSVVVAGPSGQVALPFTANLRANGSADPGHPSDSYYSATSTLRIGYASGDPEFSVCSQNYTGCAGPSEATISSSILVNANQAYTVDEVTSATAQDDAKAKATADPVFKLTAGELNAGYTLIITAGVANIAAPEPAAWALMLVGLATVGAPLRRRRASARSAMLAASRAPSLMSRARLGSVITVAGRTIEQVDAVVAVPIGGSQRGHAAG